jgi:hypothetical protein
MNGPSETTPDRTTVSNSLRRFQYFVTTQADRRRVWETYLNLENWPGFANIYGEMKWTQGQPWKVGSRLQIEVVRPVETVVERSILVCIPGWQVGWTESGMGVTIAQWVSFDDEPVGGTHIQTAGQISPSDVVIAGQSIDHLVKAFTETWYENLRRSCDKSFEVLNKRC